MNETQPNPLIALYREQLTALSVQAEYLIAKIEESKTQTRANYYNKKLRKVNADISRILQKASRILGTFNKNSPEEPSDVTS